MVDYIVFDARGHHPGDRAPGPHAPADVGGGESALGDGQANDPNPGDPGRIPPVCRTIDRDKRYPLGQQIDPPPRGERPGVVRADEKEPLGSGMGAAERPHRVDAVRGSASSELGIAYNESSVSPGGKF
jgi:hypothetical protein